MAKRRRKVKVGRVILLALILLLVLSGIGVLTYFIIKNNMSTSPYYLASENNTLTLSGEDDNTITLARGSLVNIKKKTIKIDDVEYRQFKYNDITYYCLDSDLEVERINCVKETSLYTLRSHVLTSSIDSYKISGWVNKNEAVSITGYNQLLDDGSVDYYLVNDLGYLESKYLAKEFVETGLDSSIYYDSYNYSGGDPTKIEYYHKDETNFINNKKPDVVKALYINAEAICNADRYIEIANNTNGINAFVVDIKDCYVDTQLAYDGYIYKEYAPSTYNIPNSLESYQKGVKKLKDAGYYLIGRITAFKDDSFALDNPSEALAFDGDLYKYGSVYWPSVYSRKMWEYNLALASEAVELCGFNEIQFDYVRLPEDVSDVDLKNKYGESRVQAVTNFLRYAVEYLHKQEVYVSADVFGETSGYSSEFFSAWPTAYGQYWPAISNTVDAISSMPYPDHFASYAYDIATPWIDVYDLMYAWGRATKYAQDITYDSADCRTWIMAQSSGVYDVEYTPYFIKQQIQGLSDAGVNEGYLTWNAASSMAHYEEYEEVLN